MTLIEKDKLYLKTLILSASLLLCGCDTYPVKIITEMYMPRYLVTPVSVTPKSVSLEKDNINLIRACLTPDTKKSFNRILYNYYDNYYGLQMCNNKLLSIGSYIDEYNKDLLNL
jgi:hypothetical protein